jgi:circadian clock protein KaiC
LHFTVVGEPPLKMLRYQQQFTFVDTTRVGTSVHYVNLSNATLSQGLEAMLETI